MATHIPWVRIQPMCWLRSANGQGLIHLRDLAVEALTQRKRSVPLLAGIQALESPGQA
jgi:hypothetical protein